MVDETLAKEKSLAQPPELTPWLVLLHTPGVGSVTLGRLLEHFQTPSAILEAAENGALQQAGILKESCIKSLTSPAWDKIEKDINWLNEDSNRYILTPNSDLYPKLLHEIPDPPPVLFVQGNVNLLNTLQLAIVGSRNPSPNGLQTSYEFARSLAACGLTITSGLALGIDAAAHQGALDGQGYTIAVTGTGLDRVYPASHRQLAHRIADQGALISEFPPGTAPKPDHFPRRNRLISGMSLGTLITEAALRSGSLITARLALEQGREVFAIPGSIHNPLAHGCHQLIRNGAKLVEKIYDIIEELGQFMPIDSTLNTENTVKRSENNRLDQGQQKVINNLDFEPTSMDTLVRRTGFKTEYLSATLLTLELAGLVLSGPGGVYTRCPTK